MHLKHLAALLYVFIKIVFLFVWGAAGAAPSLILLSWFLLGGRWLHDRCVNKYGGRHMLIFITMVTTLCQSSTFNSIMRALFILKCSCTVIAMHCMLQSSGFEICRAVTGEWIYIKGGKRLANEHLNLLWRNLAIMNYENVTSASMSFWNIFENAGWQPIILQGLASLHFGGA